jgi:hypothetical protein
VRVTSLTDARRRSLLFALGVALLAAAYARHLLVRYGGHTIDDAGISYAYADSLGHGRGLRATAGEAPVEGFSNFLQVLLLAPAARWPGDLDRVAKWMNVLAVALALAGLCAFVYRRAERRWQWVAVMPLLLPYCWPGFNYWIAAGLEGGLLAALQIATVLLLASARPRPGWLGMAAGLLAWTRPEGIVHGAIAVMPGRRADRWWVAPAVFVALVLALEATRLLVFGAWLPNTYWAKVHVYNQRALGLAYLQRFLGLRAFYFASLLPVIALLPRRRRPALVGLGQLAFAAYFPVQVGGDWMREFRFLQPAMGPLAALSALGLAALASGDLPAWMRERGRRLTLAAVAMGAPLAVALSLATGGAARQIAASRDVGMQRLTEVAARYRQLGRWARLPRRPLVAEVDVGGLEYRGNLEVLDLSGLTDRVLAQAFTHRPALLVDYLFGERRPDLFHLHGSWFVAAPLHALSPAYREYRALATSTLRAFTFEGLTALRGDLLDPLAAPVQPLRVTLPGALLVGLTALERDGRVVLVAHARQLALGEHPAPLTWRDRQGALTRASWHAGMALDPAPVGGALVAMATLPAGALPLTLAGGALTIDRWPLDRGAPTLAALTRLPLHRLAGAPPADCDPSRILDPAAAPASQARGVAFLARLCDGLPPPLQRRWTDQVLAAARAASDPDDRYEAATAAPVIGLPQTVALRTFIEEARARHTPYDEILTSLAADLLVPGAALDDRRLGLRLLLAARQYEAVVLEALAEGGEEGRGLLCQAVRALGLRPALTTPPCDAAPVPLPRLTRHSFEATSALTFTAGAERWLTQAAREGQDRIGGGHGRRFLNSFGGRGVPGQGAVLWGPLRVPGATTFAALVAAQDDPALLITVEAHRGGAWVEVARLPPAQFQTVMRPLRVAVPPGGEELRVRVADGSASGSLLADALTFIAP